MELVLYRRLYSFDKVCYSVLYFAGIKERRRGIFILSVLPGCFSTLYFAGTEEVDEGEV